MPDPEPSPGNSSAPPSIHDPAQAADGLAGQLRNALLELRVELSVSTRRVAAVTGLKESDLDVLDVLSRYGAQSPTALAQRMGIHPATMTGVLARLEKSNWVIRRRDVTDRRSVQVEPTGFDRLTAIYRDADERLAAIAAELTDDAGETVLGYLNRICAAVRDASAELAVGDVTPATVDGP